MKTKTQLPSPKNYQKRMAKRILESDGVALHVGMGLGKTRAVLMALEKLLKQKRKYKRVLVVGPIPVVESTWPDEIKKWGFNLDYQLIRSKKPAERVAQTETDADIYAINFEMLHWLARPEFRKFWNTLDILVIDELTKCKTTKSTPFRVFKGRRDWFKKRIGMTGTMLPESYVNLYGQMTVLNKVWGTKVNFIEKYFVDESRDPRYHKYELRSPKCKRKIQKKIKPYTLTLDSKDYLDVPEWSFIDYWFDLSSKQRKYYDKLEKEMYLQLGGDEQVAREYLLNGEDEDTTEVVADTVTSMRIKLRQAVSGFLYNEARDALTFDSTKLNFTTKVIDEIDENILLMYQLVEERKQLRDVFGAPLLKGKDAIKSWNKGFDDRAVGHPMSMGHGLNLQDGGRVLLWYSLPRSYEQYAQTIARLIRTGQKENVVIIRMLARGTIDETIVADLDRKEEEQHGFINATKSGRDRRAGRKRKNNAN